MLTDRWRKSSRSEIHGACVEGRLDWATSSRCESSHCAQIRRPPPAVLLRDSKDPTGPVLSFTPVAWRMFLGALTTGQMARAATLTMP